MVVRSSRCPLSTLILALLAPVSAPADEGRIEINQVGALAGGITPADAAGFPVTLNQSGSYVLTSDLVPGQGLPAIDVVATGVTIDLNGFALRGASPLGPVASGIVGTGFVPPQETTIRNGVVRNFRGRGIDLSSGARSHVEDVLVYGNEQGGLALAANSSAARIRARDNGLFGLQLGAGTTFQSVVASGTASGPDVIGGQQLGGSYCGDGTCRVRPRPRRYYVTIQTYNGAQADGPGVCATGFHFASLWEILDPTLLSYDTALGVTTADSGLGPPRISGGSISSFGWVRTGSVSTGTNNFGTANCSLWTSSSATQSGIVASLTSNWEPLNPGILGENETAPWNPYEVACDRLRPVWCVED